MKLKFFAYFFVAIVAFLLFAFFSGWFNVGDKSTVERALCAQIINKSSGRLEDLPFCRAETHFLDGRNLTLAVISSHGVFSSCPKTFELVSTLLMDEGNIYPLCYEGREAPEVGFGEACLNELQSNSKLVANYPNLYLFFPYFKQTYLLHPPYCGNHSSLLYQSFDNGGCLSDVVKKVFVKEEGRVSASSTVSSEACSTVPAEYYSTCLEIADYFKDAKFLSSKDQSSWDRRFCEVLNSTALRYFCFHVAAWKQRQPELCNEITDTYYRHSCLEEVAGAHYNSKLPSLAGTLEERLGVCRMMDKDYPTYQGYGPCNPIIGNLRDDCIYFASFEFKSTSACGEIIGQDQKAKCFGIKT